MVLEQPLCSGYEFSAGHPKPAPGLSLSDGGAGGSGHEWAE